MIVLVNDIANLGIGVQHVNKVRNIGKTRSEPIIFMGYVSECLKHEVLRARSRFWDAGIRVSADMPAEVRATRKQLFLFFLKGKRLGLEPRTVWDKLCIRSSL